MTSPGFVLIAGVVLRLALFATSIPASLEKRPELSTPLTSVRSCGLTDGCVLLTCKVKEGQFIFAQGERYAGQN
jgi:hypothetical protein